MPKGRFEQFLTTRQDPALERAVKEASLFPPGSEEWERALQYFDPRRGGTIGELAGISKSSHIGLLTVAPVPVCRKMAD